MTSDGFHALEHLVGCATGRARSPIGVELPESLAHGHLIACGFARDGNEAAHHALEALAAAETFGSPFVIAVAQLAVAETCPDRSASARRDAVIPAASIESPAFQRAVKGATGGGDPGMLAAFMRRLRQSRDQRAEPVMIEFLTGRVSRGGTAVRMAERELELLCAIAKQRRPTPQEQLEAMLWPDADQDSARNSFKVCLHRLRKQLGDDEAVTHTSQGYTVNERVHADIWEIEELMVPPRPGRAPSLDELERMRQNLGRLRSGRSEHLRKWTWGEPVERHIDELMRALAERIGRAALEHGDPLEALSCARDLIEHDAYDDAGRELAIRAHLASRDRRAAMLEYRAYREVLEKELGVEPPAALRELLMTDAERAEGGAGLTSRPRA